jgi:hypothetical protein
MATLGTAEIDVQISRAKVQAEVQGAARQIESGFGDTTRKVESQFASAARSAAGAFVAFKGGQFLNDAVSAASDLAESQSKVGEVFRTTSDQVLAWAENSAQAFGQSKQQALEAAGTFGNLLTAIGLADDVSQQFSTSLVELASDLASFNNVSIDDALIALRAGLTGQTEPLRRFGVNLNEAEIRNKALEMGLRVTSGTLDASTKAQAAYALIMEATTTAQGDFQRTSGDLANKQRIATAEFDNAKAELGQGLLPVMKAAAEAGIVLSRTFAALPQPLQLAAAGAAGLTLAIGLFGPVVGRGVTALRGFAAAQRLSAATAVASARSIDMNTSAMIRNQLAALRSARLFSATSAATAAAGTGLAVLAAAYIQVGRQSERAKNNVESLRQELEAGVDPAVAVGEKLAATLAGADGGFEGLKGSSKAFREEMEELGLTVEDVVENSLRSQRSKLLEDSLRDRGASREFLLNLERIRIASRDATDAESIRGEVMAEVARVSSDSAQARAADIEDAVSKWKDERAAIEAANDARADTFRAVADLRNAQAAARGDSEEYRRAQDAIVAAEKAVARAQQDTKRAQDDLTDARQRAARALKDLRFASEGSVLSEERARLRLESAREEEQRVIGDPRSTDREKQEAILSRKEAELALREAQDSRATTAQELADAERKGVEGSDDVVAAKERVTASIEAQREAEGRVAQAAQDAAKVLTDAKRDVGEATDKVTAAIIVEAEKQGDLAEAYYAAEDGIRAQIGTLEQYARSLAPNSPVRQRVNDFKNDLIELRDIISPEGIAPLWTGIPGLTGLRPIPYGPPSRPENYQGPGRTVTNNFNVSGLSQAELERYAEKQERNAMGWGD